MGVGRLDRTAIFLGEKIREVRSFLLGDYWRLAIVRFGSRAGMVAQSSDVRFTPKSGHSLPRPACPLCAKSGHYAVQQFRQLFDHLVSEH